MTSGPMAPMARTERRPNGTAIASIRMVCFRNAGGSSTRPLRTGSRATRTATNATRGIRATAEMARDRARHRLVRCDDLRCQRGHVDERRLACGHHREHPDRRPEPTQNAPSGIRGEADPRDHDGGQEEAHHHTDPEPNRSIDIGDEEHGGDDDPNESFGGQVDTEATERSGSREHAAGDLGIGVGRDGEPRDDAQPDRTPERREQSERSSGSQEHGQPEHECDAGNAGRVAQIVPLGRGERRRRQPPREFLLEGLEQADPDDEGRGPQRGQVAETLGSKRTRRQTEEPVRRGAVDEEPDEDRQPLGCSAVTRTRLGVAIVYGQSNLP